MKRFFYVLYLPDQAVAGCVDAIRFLLNPLEKQSAHVTVRGPYSNPIPGRPLKTINDRLRGNRLFITGVGRFDSPNQHTVFFDCDGTHLHRVWQKRDFGYHPHLTLYDGKDGSIAQRLTNIASTYSFNLSFVSDHLAQMASMKGQLNLAFSASFQSTLVEMITGRQLHPENVPDLDIDERFRLVDALLGWLSARSTQSPLPSHTVCDGLGTVLPRPNKPVRAGLSISVAH